MIYIVTGVSRGLGKALVEQLLTESHRVIGIGRSHAFQDKNFEFLPCDLSDIDAVDKLQFDSFDGAVTLINNAAVLGNVKQLSTSDKTDFEEVMRLNATAPLHLSLKVYSAVQNKSDFTLINISSGAGKHAIPSWAAYCASKAALDMWTTCFKIEENEKGNSPRIHAISPGVIDTEMQNTIRSSSEKDFSLVDKFIEYKENQELYSTKECASRIINFLENATTDEVLIDIRNPF